MALSGRARRQNGIKLTNKTTEWHYVDEQDDGMALSGRTRHYNGIKWTNETSEWHVHEADEQNINIRMALSGRTRH